MTADLETGIEVLDRKLDGGVPAGRVLLLSAAPASQSELFLYEMAATRPTVYLTTERTVEDVEASLGWAGTPTDGVDVRRVDASRPLGSAGEALEDLPETATLVVDPLRPLERTDPAPYRSFLNALKRRTRETGSLALLHGTGGRDVPGQRDRTEYHADAVFDLSTSVRGGTVKNSLTVRKFRGGRALQESIELDLSADVTIDVSRKIA